ncbi:DNA polymerase I [Aestuariivirga litoralis]|uniref:DNA polymerase I n=1 Tax=Aestuariivirga litoralis TaxID=2650924 RepID=UPI001FF05A0F|nr:DNA polymerase I [Aestuariivirga litoralis]MBG1232902.1 DNA polymerase I [Aestuariivirga litoralis]
MSENLHAPSSLKSGDHLYLIDGSGYIFRAYFQSTNQDPKYNKRSDGLPVGAVRLYCNMVWSLLKIKTGPKPTHLAVIFDASAKSFRNDFYPEYKAHRPDPPAEMRPQFGLIRHATRAFNLPSIEMDGYEADDLIATYAKQAAAAGATVRIISSDKDLMQLIGPGIELYDPGKDKVIGEAEVLEKFGVTPDKVIDVQSLAGDSVDNVPGVPGIGLKTGAELINTYGNLETLLEKAPEIKQNKRRENLINFAEQARISKRLVTLDQNVPITAPVESFAVEQPRASELVGFLKAMEITTLTKTIATALEADMSAIEPVTVPFEFWPPEGGVIEVTEQPKSLMLDMFSAARDVHTSAGQEDIAANLRAIPVNHAGYETVTTIEALDKWIAAAFNQPYVCIDTETDSLDAMQANIVGVSLSVVPGKACYIPLGHRTGGGDLFTGDALLPGQIKREEAFARLKPLFEAPHILKIGQNLKYDMLALKQLGISVAPIDDTMLLSYVTESGDVGHGMDELSERHLGHKPIAFKEVAGSGKSAVSFDRVPIDRATAYAAEDADITLRLWLLFKHKLLMMKKVSVYETLERPLVPVLLEMENAGISVDRAVLAKLSGEFAGKQQVMEEEIHKLAGHPFNIGSPKQLGDILFGEMGLPGGKKTATGAWSTDASTLDDLANEGVEMARKILEWRQVAKLRSTYTEALPEYINPKTLRVHTSYAMASTSTGRLSSTDPNLQNIPVRTEDGRRIRTAFVATEGHKLISADYSQIELRVLAHIADIPQLKKAFEDGLDIHAMTASEMFNVPIEGMESSVRRRAKAINFGIIYGISAFGLSNQLSISREEAGEYIRTYFKRFPGIRDYMDATKAAARANGYVETIFGRRMHFPRIHSPNPSEKAFLERASINAPIQGSAADIIRRAMVRMIPALSEAGLKARMLLQVHDELIFEAPDAEASATCALVQKVMVGAPEPAVKLTVPLQVDARAANNWDEAH